METFEAESIAASDEAIAKQMCIIGEEATTNDMPTQSKPIASTSVYALNVASPIPPAVDTKPEPKWTKYSANLLRQKKSSKKLNDVKTNMLNELKERHAADDKMKAELHSVQMERERVQLARDKLSLENKEIKKSILLLQLHRERSINSQLKFDSEAEIPGTQVVDHNTCNGGRIL